MNTIEEIFVYGALAALALIVFIISIIAGIIRVLWYLFARPIEKILEEKYAKNEISEEEYNDLKNRFWWHHG